MYWSFEYIAMGEVITAHIVMKGAHFTADFSIIIKLDGNLILLSSKLQWRDRYEILHMAWQLCCHGMCNFF